MTEIGSGRRAGGYGQDVPPAWPDHDPARDGYELLSHGESAPPDAALRRQAAEANARAAEAAAAAAAADAKAAIELAARAAAAADAAAQAAVQADAAVRAAAAAEALPAFAPPLDARPPFPGAAHAAHSAPQAPRHGAPDGPRHGDPSGNAVSETDVLGRVPSPRPIPSRRVDTDGTGTAPGGGRAARRRAAAAETTVFDVPSYDVPSYGDAAYGDAAYGDAAYGDAAYGDAAYGDAAYGDAAYDDAAYDDRAYDDGPGEPVTELVDTRATGEQPTALVATGGRRRARPADDDLVDSGIDVLPGAGEDDEAPADAVSETGGRRAARRAAGKRRGLFRRRWPLLAAGVVVGVIGLTGIVLLNSGDAAPQPTAVVESAPVVPELPTASDASDGQDEAAGPSQGDPLSDRGSTFLSALREAGVPTSRGGAAETEAAELVCGELADGVDEARIARALPASLPTVTRAQAADLVEIAKENYCTS